MEQQRIPREWTKYFDKAALKNFLKKKFPETEERCFGVQHINGRWIFTAPSTVSESDYQIQDVCCNNLSVKILDLSPTDSLNPWTQQCPTHTVIKNSVEFERALTVSNPMKLRIISFHSTATYQPLNASVRDFETLFSTYGICLDFQSTLTAFGRVPDPANGYTATPTGLTVRGTKSFEAWYRLQYPELNNRSKEEPWSVRHTAIYHQYNEATDSTLIVLVNPCRNSAFESMIFNDDLEHKRRLLERLLTNPMDVHQFLCGMYLHNWSPYIRDQSKIQADINDDVQTSDLKSGSLESDFRLAQKLRSLRNTSFTCRALCQDNINVLNELCRILPGISKDDAWLSVARAQAEARRESVILLQDRIQNDIELLEHIATQRDSRINHHNQATAANLNETLLNLTYNTVDDSATIKIITIFSLIFLPGSFIASIFGMNFFVFEGPQQDGNGAGGSNNLWNGLTIGQNFWIFISIWLPVTALVLLIYAGVVWRRLRNVKMRRVATIKADKEGEV